MSHDLTRRRLLGAGLGAAGMLVLDHTRPAGAWASTPRARSRSIALPYARRIGPVVVPGGLQLAGLRWPGGEHVDAELRARRSGGPWGAWAPLGHAHDHAPDAHALRHGATDPVWTGRADEVQVRLSRPLHGLRLQTVVTSGRPAPQAHAAQLGGAPAMVTRAQWGGNTLKTRGTPEYGEVHMAFVHHTVNANTYGPGDSAAIVLAIAQYHINANGWNDIGYNFLVDRFGTIFEGRAGGIDRAVIGAQAQGYNSESTGVANLGTFTDVPQTDAAIDAMSRLIAWKLALHGAPVLGSLTLVSKGGEDNRYASGTPVLFQRISGHRDGDATSCPGDALYAQLPALRTRTAAITPVGAPLPPTGVGGLTLAAPVAAVAAGSPTWQTVSRVTSGPDGTFAGQVALKRTTAVRARVPAVSGSEPVESEPVQLTLVPALTATVLAAHIQAGRSARVAVVATTRRPRIVLSIARQGGDGRWVSAGRVAMTVSGLRAGASVKLVQPGLYRFTATAPADRNAAVARAPQVFVRAVR